MQLAAAAKVRGDLDELQLADLRLTLDRGADSASQPALEVKGDIARMTLVGTPLLDGIALEVKGATSTAELSGWLGRPLPDLGPIQGQWTMSGSSSAVQVTDAKLQAGSADRLAIAATGGIGEIRLGRDPMFRAVDLHLDAKAPDGGSVGALLDVPIRPLGALIYTGRLSGEAAAWGLSGKIQVGRTVIEEDLTASYAGARPRIAGKLSVPVLDLGDFGIAARTAPAGDEPPRSSPAGPSSVATLAALDAVDLALKIDLGQVEGTTVAIGRGDMDVTLEKGVLRIDPARFDFAAGTALVHATADARSEPPAIDLSLHADDVELGEFLRAMGRSAPISGELALILKLQSRGERPEQLIPALNGEAHFAVQRGGVQLGSLHLATADVMTWLIAGAERGTALVRGITTSGQTKLECFAGRFVIADGIATAQSLLMKTPLTLSTTTGSLNLVDRTMDLEVHLRARRESKFDPATTYRISGPLTDPAVHFSKTAFAARTIAGVVLKPLDVLGSLLLPLVDDGGKDPSNPCLQPAS